MLAKIAVLLNAIQFLIFGGDFNLIVDVHTDKKDGIPTTHSKSRHEEGITEKNFELTDIWRVLNQMAHVEKKKNRNLMQFRFFNY